MKSNLFMDVCKNILSAESFSILRYAQEYNLQQGVDDDEIYKTVDALNELIEKLDDSIFHDFGVLSVHMLEIPTSCKPCLTYNGDGLTIHYFKLCDLGITEEFVPFNCLGVIDIELGFYDEGILENTELVKTGFACSIVDKYFYA